jgi:hypothetical protein
MDSRIDDDHPTAMFVVQFFMEMNRIFLQDMTAIAGLHPESTEHPIYCQFPVFQSTEWDVSFRLDSLASCFSLLSSFELYCPPFQCNLGVQGVNEKGTVE